MLAHYFSIWPSSGAAYPSGHRNYIDQRLPLVKTRTCHSVHFLLLLAPILLVSGCTTALWDKSTFAHYYRPADSSNLRLFYSNDRKDVLVQYDERQDSDDHIRSRCYWLDRNNANMSQKQKPAFVSPESAGNLVPIPVQEGTTNSPTDGLHGLYAVARREDDFFILYSGREELDRYHLPVYSGDSSQRVKQVLLTPFAVAVDATIVGAVVGYYAAPSILSGLNR